MKVGDLVIRKGTEHPDGFCEATKLEIGLVIENLKPDFSWNRPWAILWCDTGTPKFRMEDGTSVVYESEVEIVSLA